MKALRGEKSYAGAGDAIVDGSSSKTTVPEVSGMRGGGYDGYLTITKTRQGPDIKSAQLDLPVCRGPPTHFPVCKLHVRPPRLQLKKEPSIVVKCQP